MTKKTFLVIFSAVDSVDNVDFVYLKNNDYTWDPDNLVSVDAFYFISDERNHNFQDISIAPSAVDLDFAVISVCRVFITHFSGT